MFLNRLDFPRSLLRSTAIRQTLILLGVFAIITTITWLATYWMVTRDTNRLVEVRLANLIESTLAFAQKCFISYSMLLPGHGARPAEMLDISRDDWVAAAEFGVGEMQSEVDEVYVGGFSLGGLLALQTAMNDEDIAGVFAFSPALELHRSIYLDQTIWLRHIADWLDTDPPDDSWRFESIPFNALAETQLFAKSVRSQLERKPLEIPVFIAQSPDDAVVNAAANRKLFDKRIIHRKSRLLSYSGKDSHDVSDIRILNYPSELPEQRILSYAHQAVHISPDNKHYGVNGKYRNCHNNDINVDAAAIDYCQRIDTPFRGEVFGNAVKRYDTNTVDSLARLTFNPQFSQLMDEIDLFLQSLSRNEVVVEKLSPDDPKHHSSIVNVGHDAS